MLCASRVFRVVAVIICMEFTRSIDLRFISNFIKIRSAVPEFKYADFRNGRRQT